MKLQLTTRIVLAFVLLAAALLAAVGVLSFRSGSESLKAAAIAQVNATAIEKEAALNSWLEERLNNIDQLASHPDLLAKAARLTAAVPASAEARSAHADLRRELEPQITAFGSAYLELFVMEPEGGKVLVSTSPAEEGKSKLGQPYFDRGRTELYVQLPYLSPDLGAAGMTIASPLRAADGRVAAVLAVRLNLTVLSAIVQRRSPVRQTEDAFLINADRFLVTQPRFMAEPAVLRRQLDTVAVRRCAAGESGTALAADYRDVPSIAVYRWNAKWQLGLIVKIDRTEALAPAHAFGRSVFLFSALTLLATAGLAVVLARTVTRPLRALHEGVKRFAAGHIEQPVLETSGDEVGLVAHEFNHMAARVSERTAELAKSNVALLAENAKRQRVEGELREREAALSVAQRIGQIGNWELDLASQQLSWSREIFRIFEIDPEKFGASYETFLRTIHPEDRAKVDAAYTLSLHSRQPYEITHRLLLPDGRIKHVHERGETHCDDSGRPIRSVGTVQDITKRTQAEESLRESERRYQSLAETSPAGVFRTDPNGQTTYVNARWCELTGLSVEEARGEGWLRAIHPEDREALVRGWREASKTQGLSESDYRLLRRDGSVIWVIGRAMPDRDAAGRLVGYVGTITDITEHKRAEKVLQESEARYRALFDGSADGILIADNETLTFKYANPAMCRMLGYTVDELQTLGVSDIHPPDDLPAVIAEFAALAREDRTMATDLPMLRKDGSVFPAEINTTRITIDGRPCSAGFFRDITERKKSEAAVRLSEERFRVAAETANDAIYEWDLKDGLEWLGKIDALLGYEPGEFPRTLSGWAASVHPEDLERTMAAVQAHLAGSAPYACEYRVRRKDGAYRWWAARGAVIRTPEGKPIRWIGSITDITERKQAADALQETELRLAHAMSMAQLFAWEYDVASARFIFSDRYYALHGTTAEREGGNQMSAPDFARNFVHPDDAHQVAEEVGKAMATTEPNYRTQLECRIFRRDGELRHVLVTTTVTKDAAGRTIQLHGANQDITERKQAEAALRESEQRYRTLFESMDEGFCVIEMLHDPDGKAVDYRFVEINPAFEKHTGLHQALGKTIRQMVPNIDAQSFDIYGKVARTGEAIRFEIPADALHRFFDVYAFRIGGDGSQSVGTLFTDITGRKQAERRLEQAHTQLLAASRQAGMAEFATGILHNVGNVLNSVNVATTCLADSVKRSRSAGLDKLVALMREHEGDLGAFLTHDPKGTLIPTYLADLAGNLAAEQVSALKELAAVQKNIEHLKSIISVQQDSAKRSSSLEPIALADLVEDSLKLNANGLARAGLQVTKEFAELPPLLTEKHTVLQILVNLVRNAVQACEGSAQPAKRLTIRMSQTAGRVRLEVTDNGSGISPENLSRIFAHGFTTKQDGHGFGLHSGALAAQELGGSLSVHSDGPGHGATFVLELPCKPDTPTA